MKTKERMSEAAEQTTLFQWARLMEKRYPELALMHHIPNGGSRNKIEAANLKRQGVKAGVPDVCLPVAKGDYHGLYIEMKAHSGRPSQKQKEWLLNLKAQGYQTAVCYGWEEAKNVIVAYLEGDGQLGTAG